MYFASPKVKYREGRKKQEESNRLVAAMTVKEWYTYIKLQIQVKGISPQVQQTIR